MEGAVKTPLQTWKTPFYDEIDARDCVGIKAKDAYNMNIYMTDKNIKQKPDLTKFSTNL